MALEVQSWGGRLSSDVIPEIEEKTIDSKQVGSLLILCCKEKTLLDLWKYFYRLNMGFGSTPKAMIIGFESQPNS